MTRFKKYVLALVALGLAPAGVAQLTTFEVIDYPGSVGTFAYGTNDAGDIVGMYYTPDRNRHGFLLRRGQFTTIEFPGASQTAPYKVNGRGDVAGVYYDSSNKQHGFLLSSGTFQTIDFPGADQTMVYGLNSTGDVTGMYFAPGDPKHYGWALISGRFFTIDHPLPNDMSCGTWIGDSGEVAGHVKEKNGAYHGYIWKDGKFTLFEFERGEKWQWWDGPAEINATGDILGTYSDARMKQRAFLLREGIFTTFDVPGSQSTRSTGMNRSGQVVGLFVDGGGITHGFLTSVAPGSRSLLLTVDDDGADCPGALRTIQEAVAQGAPGATIQVCPGIYFKTVTIAGAEKNGLKLIALGRQDEVVLQGDYTERDGFHLKGVNNVLIRGFTVRDFGNKPTTEKEWGAGNQIYLENAHYNTIEHNTLINGDMMGIMLVDSGNNIVQQNLAFVDNTNLANCGIHVAGGKSANNSIHLNMAWGNKFAGIMIRGAGPGNYVMDNTVVSNGRFGIDVQNTSEIRIEGNRVSYNRGFWGTTPGGQQSGVGINLMNVNKAMVFDNRARSNSGVDLNWDGKGENRLEANACDNSTPASGCPK